MGNAGQLGHDWSDFTSLNIRLVSESTIKIRYSYILQNDDHRKLVNIHHHNTENLFSCDDNF